jgi:predicted DCC family thiol-disulfide oxidoreductase YuxK
VLNHQVAEQQSVLRVPPGHPVVFFDGDCTICNASVDFLLKHDKRNEFLFAPLQGETARALLPPLPTNSDDWSMMLVDERGTYDRSDAALRVVARLGGPWALAGLALHLPRWLRDSAYRLIARNRYRVFGHHDTCRVPTEAERARFLP